MLKEIILILILLFGEISSIPQELYPLKNKKPTTRGIDTYVKNNKYKIISEFEAYVKDSIFLDVNITTDNLSTYEKYDSLDLAYHITYVDGSDEIVIENQPKFLAYDIQDVTKFKKIFISTFNNFVKTTMIHELAHTYFLQITLELRYNNLDVYPEYNIKNRIRMFPNIEEDFGAEFIEEGICQYIVNNMKQMINISPFIPITLEDIVNKKNNFQIKYNYSQYYLKDFLDYMGLKKGMMILIQNKPPTYREILNPDLFFNRLN
jgi:hypothetical protein